MSENNKTEEFLQKLAPRIERSNLDACVEETARVAREMGVGGVVGAFHRKRQSKDIRKINPIKPIWKIGENLL